MRVQMNRITAISLCSVVLALTAGCQTLKPNQLSNDELAREFYEVQIQTLETLDQAFLRISQEYYTMSVEYKKMNQPELADLTLKKAEMFQKQHQEYEKRVADLQVRRARALRGESPEAQEAPLTQREAAPVKAPAKKPLIQTKPIPKTPMPAAKPAPAQAPAPAPAPAPAQEPAPALAPAEQPAAPPPAPPAQDIPLSPAAPPATP